MILCNPSNPCGKVLSKEELEYIASLAIKYDTYVITDEVYEHIVYAHTNIHILPLYRVCLKEPFLVVPYLKRIPLQGGV